MPLPPPPPDRIQFQLAQPKRKTSAIRMALQFRLSRTENKRTVLCAIGQSVEVNKWDKKNGFPKNRQDTLVLRDYLNQLRSHVEQQWIQDTPRVASEVKSWLQRLLQPDRREQENVFTVLWDYVDKLKHTTGKRNYQYFRTLFYDLQDFAPHLRYTDIDEGFLFDLQQWYLSEKPGRPEGRNRKPQRDYTVFRKFVSIRAMLEYLHEKELISSDFKKFRSVRGRSNEKYILSYEQIIQLCTTHITREPNESDNEVEKQQHTQRIMLFLFFTSQRYSDYSSFSKEQVVHINNLPHWKFQIEKTGKPHMIPLYGFYAPAYQVLQYYDFDLPKFSNAMLNRRLKTIGRKVGLTDQVTTSYYHQNQRKTERKPIYMHIDTHQGRQACSTFLAQRGVPITHIKENNKHADIQTTMIYANLNSKELDSIARHPNLPQDVVMKIG